MTSKPDSLDSLLRLLGGETKPQIRLMENAFQSASRLGVFSSSFNPVTRAHTALVESASAAFALDHVLALASDKNADKRSYDVSLRQRLEMMLLAFTDSAHVSIGVTSHAFFADMIDALLGFASPGTGIYFILGFDTLERVVDSDGKYLGRYYRQFSTSDDALRYLLSYSHLIVANRGAAGRDDLLRVTGLLPARLRGQVFQLDLPGDLAEISATTVRSLAGSGKDLSGFVPERVGEYIKANGLYST
ncbi:MAG TPA: nicotinate-nicotinamide nucleotide adenylyltransferase [Blastocatellia bacterium]|nr:nicotinate-nicotinamide nucleotide adenylyltransferase [Blastocatellia bacterium]